MSLGLFSMLAATLRWRAVRRTRPCVRGVSGLFLLPSLTMFSNAIASDASLLRVCVCARCRTAAAVAAALQVLRREHSAHRPSALHTRLSAAKPPGQLNAICGRALALLARPGETGVRVDGLAC